MTSIELQQSLSILSLSQVEAAQLLGVNPRTVRRWVEGEEIPGPVEQVLCAWKRLNDRHLPWRPDSVAIIEDDQEQIGLYRSRAINLSEILARVEERNCDLVGWKVDREKQRATIGPIEISYYKLRNGSFSLAAYTRKDINPDLKRDWKHIEDAVYCIARELRKEPEFGPVTLVYYDRSGKFGLKKPTFEDFSSNGVAIERVCKLMGSPNFHDPAIIARLETDSAVVWDKHELRQECVRRQKSENA